MIQLIVSDMDGTLLDNKLAVSEGNQLAIQAAEENGIKFMVATGRGYTEAVPALTEAGISCPMISVNGAQTYDKNGQLIDSIGIDKKDIREILAFTKANGLYTELVMSSGVYSNDKLQYVETLTHLLKTTNPHTSYKMALVLALGRMDQFNMNYVDEYEEVLADDKDLALKVLVFSNQGQTELQSVRDEFGTDSQLVITSSFFNNIEINHVDAQKGIALERVAKKLNIPMEKVMSIGDNFNDVSMLKRTGVSFAMANAEDGVKERAKYMTASNSEDGVAEAIYRCINEKL
ncbi:Phosphatase YwpJ [Jeotgalibaca dankookensis]|uniref:Phosphatase YwpJ n=1 Tax=Jeotgalibaca dankookensis TaxID=708126 RepID=A0A1S6IQ30_9LACT|nr:Cof-type HAD-IIB family hydrolase [Jeotgalibaca dankookensis]AQS53657.1 Phosphatase YwpJ [Jeotgalibaca dankookensis]